MNDTLSQLYANTYASLGQPPDQILSRFELGTIVYRNLSYRLEAVRQSEQAVQISPDPLEFTLNGDEVNLTTLASDFVIPLWAEYQSWSFSGNPVWVYLPTVHLSMLAKQRDMGMWACSFFGSGARDVRFKSSLYGNEISVFTPTPTIHVYYSPDIPFPDNENQTIDLPNNLVNMVQYDALIDSLPLMMTNGAKLVTDDPSLAPQIASWKGLYAHYLERRREFEKYFDKWRTESRGSHRPTRRGDILSNVLGGGNSSFPFFISSGGE